MFKKHIYEFNGQNYQQENGGPIGLRGTCAVAKLIMAMFDGKWEKILEELMISTKLIARYVDDGRAILHPIKNGWRWEDGNLKYCIRWEEEDRDVSPETVTKKVILGTLETWRTTCTSP